MKNAKVSTPALEAGVEPIKHVTLAKSLAMHASGHKPHSEHFKGHGAGHTMHDDHVEKLCGGGYMAKGKNK